MVELGRQVGQPKSRRGRSEEIRDDELRHWYTAGLLIVLCLASVARCWQLSDTWLWYDEVFGATFASQSFVDLTVSTARFDIHPPAWSWQLYFWAIGGESDTFLLVNSIVWSVATIGMVYFAVAQYQNRRIALLAATLLAVMPVSVAYARMLRMYSLLMFFLVLAWHANRRYLQTGSTKHWALMVISQLVIAYSHGTGILLNVYVGVAGLLFHFSREPLPQSTSESSEGLPRSLFRRWLVWQALLGVLSVGGLANAIVRKVSHTQAPNLEQIVHTLAEFLFGPQTSSLPMTGWAALAATVALVWFGLLVSVSRRATLAWLVVPLAMTLLVSYSIKPLWHLHAIVPLAPFVAIVLAQIVFGVYVKVLESDAIVPWVVPVVMSLVFIGLGSGFVGWHLTQFRKETEYPWVAERLSDELKKGDIVYIPQLPDFWGVARYSVGHDWGSPLEIQDLEPTDDRWGKLVQRLGPQWRKRLHLDPKSDFIEYDGFQMYTGLTTGERLGKLDSQRILVVQSRRPELPVIAGYESGEIEEHDDIQLIHFHRLNNLPWFIRNKVTP